MGKYSALSKYLEERNEDGMTLSFSEIEDILELDLPKSARKYRPWWANDKSHTQAKDGWLGVGWNTRNVNMKEETVEFTRSGERETRSPRSKPITSPTNAAEFEEMARGIMEDYLSVKILSPRDVVEVPKTFDFVSEDHKIIGDAKFYSMVRGKRIPPAKFSAIAEHVWLLEKTSSSAKEKFLVFGNDRRVPEEWLKRYGHLVKEVNFYFIDDEGNVLELGKNVQSERH